MNEGYKSLYININIVIYVYNHIGYKRIGDHMPKSLATRLAELTPVTSQADAKWVAFVKDHRSFLMKSTTVVKLDPHTTINSRYRIHEMLDRLDVDVTLGWVTLWLSGIESNASLVGVTELRVPTSSAFNDLFASYQTHSLQTN